MIRSAGMTINTMYISPKANPCEEKTILDRLEKISREGAIILGDFNARHEIWKEKVIWRKEQLGELAKQWKGRSLSLMSPPISPEGGAVHQMLCVKKRHEVKKARTGIVDIGNNSDHRPITVTVESINGKEKEIEPFQNARIKTKMASCEKNHFRKGNTKLVEELKKCRTEEEPVTTYRKNPKSFSSSGKVQGIGNLQG